MEVRYDAGIGIGFQIWRLFEKGRIHVGLLSCSTPRSFLTGALEGWVSG